MEITPKTPWKDRRIKEGTRADRNALAEVLKVGKAVERSTDPVTEIKPEVLRSAYILAACILGCAILMLVFCKGCHASIIYPDKDDVIDQQSIKAIIGEAENQGHDGMLAVACGIRNRGTLKGVFGLHAPRVRKHLYSELTYNEAQYVWNESLNIIECDNIIHGAQYWENVNAFGLPYWARGMVKTAVVRDHVFFRKD